MPKTIVVASPKGGVGKTTTVINLSTSLAIAKKNVLIVDMDPQGATSIGLGYGNGKIVKSLSDVMSDEKQIFKAVYPVIFNNMFILPCKLTTELQEKQLLENSKNIFRFKSALFNLVLNRKWLIDYILIDTPPTINNLTISALIAADSVLIPLQCGLFSLEATKKIIKTIKTIKSSFNPLLNIEGILVTFFENGTKLSRQILSELPVSCRKYLFHTTIKKNCALGYSVLKHRPVALVDFYSSGAQAYFSLASEIIRKNNDDVEDPGRFFYI
jgi:chromosome partitioning protein